MNERKTLREVLEMVVVNGDDYTKVDILTIEYVDYASNMLKWLNDDILDRKVFINEEVIDCDYYERFISL